MRNPSLVIHCSYLNYDVKFNGVSDFFIAALPMEMNNLYLSQVKVNLFKVKTSQSANLQFLVPVESLIGVSAYSYNVCNHVYSKNETCLP